MIYKHFFGLLSGHNRVERSKNTLKSFLKCFETTENSSKFVANSAQFPLIEFAENLKLYKRIWRGFDRDQTLYRIEPDFEGCWRESDNLASFAQTPELQS